MIEKEPDSYLKRPTNCQICLIFYCVKKDPPVYTKFSVISLAY